MSKISIDLSIENFFQERADQLNPRHLSKEYFYLSEKYHDMFNELKKQLPEKLQKNLRELSDLEVEMEALHLDLIFEQAFLEGAKFMRYLQQVGEIRISRSIQDSNLTV